MLAIKSEIDSGLTGIINALTADAENADKLISSLQNFASDTKLKGIEFEEVRSILNNYITILQSRKNVANSLKEGIEGAVNHISGFMGEYTELDSGKLDEIKRQLSNVNYSLNQALESLRKIEDPLGTDATTEAKPAMYYGDIGYLRSEVNRLSKLVDKLEQLDANDGTAYGYVSSKLDSLNSYATSANAMNPCSINIEI